MLRSRYSLSKAAVPFGALVTPLPSIHSPSLPPLLQRSPTVCDACGAYLNAYCKVRVRCGVNTSRPCQPWQNLSAAQQLFLVFVQVQANNVTWQCCFCHTSNNPVGVTDLRVFELFHNPFALHMSIQCWCSASTLVDFLACAFNSFGTARVNMTAGHLHFW